MPFGIQNACGEVANNDFGRIGRNFLRYWHGRVDSPLQVVVVNASGGVKNASQLLKYDSMLGTFRAGVKIVDNEKISVDGKLIKVVSSRDPLKLPWAELVFDTHDESRDFQKNQKPVHAPKRVRNKRKLPKSNHCTALLKQDCRHRAASLGPMKMFQVGFSHIVAAHTNMNVGDSSFVDTCRHMKKTRSRLSVPRTRLELMYTYTPGNVVTRYQQIYLQSATPRKPLRLLTDAVFYLS